MGNSKSRQAQMELINLRHELDRLRDEKVNADLLIAEQQTDLNLLRRQVNKPPTYNFEHFHVKCNREMTELQAELAHVRYEWQEDVKRMGRTIQTLNTLIDEQTDQTDSNSDDTILPSTWRPKKDIELFFQRMHELYEDEKLQGLKGKSDQEFYLIQDICRKNFHPLFALCTHIMGTWFCNEQPNSAQAMQYYNEGVKKGIASFLFREKYPEQDFCVFTVFMQTFIQLMM